MTHWFGEGLMVKIVTDLSGKMPETVGRTAQIKKLLPVQAGQHPLYKVLVFGDKGFVGGIFEVDQREIERSKD